MKKLNLSKKLKKGKKEARNLLQYIGLALKLGVDQLVDKLDFRKKK